MENFVTQNNIPVGVAQSSMSSSEKHSELANTSPTEAVSTQVATVEPKIKTIPTRQFEHLWAEVELNLIRSTGGNAHANALTAQYVLGVTSAVAGEGKTTVAENLAESAAQSTWRKVCLIDLSLNSDDIADRNGIACGEDGVVSLLERPVEDGEHTVSIPTFQLADRGGFTIVPAGKTPQNAAKIARSPELPVMINSLREHFDLIIIDMPAVATGLALPIAAETDGVVFVTRAGATPVQDVKDAIAKIGRNAIVGLVLNRIKFSGPEWLRKRLS